jgi:hypothetical protein
VAGLERIQKGQKHEARRKEEEPKVIQRRTIHIQCEQANQIFTYPIQVVDADGTKRTKFVTIRCLPPTLQYHFH